MSASFCFLFRVIVKMENKLTCPSKKKKPSQLSICTFKIVGSLSVTGQMVPYNSSVFLFINFIIAPFG